MSQQLLCYFKGDQGTEGMPPQQIGALRVQRPNGLEVVGRCVFNTGEWWGHSAKAQCLQGIKRLFSSQMTRQVMKIDHIAAGTGHTEEGPFGALWLDRYQR